MIETAQHVPEGKTVRELLRFLEDIMQAIVRVDLGEPGVSQLTLLEMRVLLALAESGRAMEIGELARSTAVSLGQCGQACEGLRGRGLAERAGGGRGAQRSIAISSAGRKLVASLEASRRTAVEGFVSRLSDSDRLRVDGAAHLLGGGLDRISRGMLAA